MLTLHGQRLCYPKLLRPSEKHIPLLTQKSETERGKDESIYRDREWARQSGILDGQAVLVGLQDSIERVRLCTRQIRMTLDLIPAATYDFCSAGTAQYSETKRQPKCSDRVSGDGE